MLHGVTPKGVGGVDGRGIQVGGRVAASLGWILQHHVVPGGGSCFHETLPPSEDPTQSVDAFWVYKSCRSPAAVLY